jgi:hypothetical protein
VYYEPKIREHIETGIEKLLVRYIYGPDERIELLHLDQPTFRALTQTLTE